MNHNSISVSAEKNNNKFFRQITFLPGKVVSSSEDLEAIEPSTLLSL